MFTERKRLCWTVCLALMLGAILSIGVMTFANGKTITGLGAGTIANPTLPADILSPWTGSKVYFGSKEDPILFNVLRKDETHFTSTDAPTLLLDCASVLQKRAFDDNSNNWKDSTIRGWLNGEFMESRFTDGEIAAIASSTKSSKAEGYDGQGIFVIAGWAPLNKEKIFLLDVAEVTNPNYGFWDSNSVYFAQPMNSRIKKLAGEKCEWWMRSPVKTNSSKCSFVSKEGGCVIPYEDEENIGSDKTYGVSPALNVDIAHVLFASEISSGIYKLTIADADNRIIGIQKDAAITRDSETRITVPYTIDKGSNHISLLITNAKNDSYEGIAWSSVNGWSSGAEKQCYTTAAITGTSGTVTLKLPDNYEVNRNDWKVWLLAEQVNSGNRTDYASAPKEISIPRLLKYDSSGGSGSMPMAKMTAKGKRKLAIGWVKVKGAAGYDIFFAQCRQKGKKAVFKKVKNIKGNKIFKWTKSGLKKGRCYKVYVKAYVKKDGKKKYVSKSPYVYAYAGNGNKKYTNAKAVKVKKAKVTLKKGKSFKIKAKVTKVKKGKKLMPKSRVAKVRYLSTNTKVATVSKRGKIKAKGKGKCEVYAYAHNGVSKKVKVTVK